MEIQSWKFQYKILLLKTAYYLEREVHVRRVTVCRPFSCLLDVLKNNLLQKVSWRFIHTIYIVFHSMEQNILFLWDRIVYWIFIPISYLHICCKMYERGVSELLYNSPQYFWKNCNNIFDLNSNNKCSNFDFIFMIKRQ